MLGLRTLKDWPPRRWAFAMAMTLASGLAIGLPTDVIPNPIFGRQGTPVEPWAIPVLVATAALSGLLAATYFEPDRTSSPTSRTTADSIPDSDDPQVDGPTTLASIGGFMSFFAIGCPICNKLVVVALGTSGALTWFAPVQPYMGLIALALLTWALRTRVRGEVACSIPAG